MSTPSQQHPPPHDPSWQPRNQPPPPYGATYQQPYGQPPPPPAAPRRKRRRWPWILLAALAAVVIAAVASGGGNDPAAPTPAGQVEQPADPPAPAPVEDDPMTDGGWAMSDVQIDNNSIVGASISARIMNLDPVTRSGLFTITVFDEGGARVADATGAANDVEAGQTVTVTFIPTGDELTGTGYRFELATL